MPWSEFIDTMFKHKLVSSDNADKLSQFVITKYDLGRQDDDRKKMKLLICESIKDKIEMGISLAKVKIEFSFQKCIFGKVRRSLYRTAIFATCI